MLEMLNDKPLQPVLSNNDEFGENSNFVSEIPSYNKIIEKLVSIDKTVPDEFKKYINSQMVKVEELIKLNYENYAYTCNVLKFKCELYFFLQKKILNLIKQNTKNEKRVIMLIELLEEINQLIPTKEQQIINIINNYHDSNIGNNIVNKSQIDKDKITIENENLKSILKEQTKSKSLLEEDYKILQIKCDKYKNENTILTNQLLNKAKTLSSPSIDSSIQQPQTNNKNYSTIPIQKSKKTLSGTPLYTRTLSKEAMMEIINEIYKSKTFCDAKNIQSNLPIETLEQHMYHYLNNKYGLKNITVEMAAKIIEGVKNYSKKNSEICLFGMILRNELEENSINIAEQIKLILNESLIFFLKSIHKFKDIGEINEIASKIRNGFIDEDIWVNIIELVFAKDKNECEIVKKKVYDHINGLLAKSLTTINRNRNTLSREERELIEEVKDYQRKIKYSDLYDILLFYHMRTRDKYLKRFKFSFKKCDRDLNGVLSKEEFYQLIIDLNLFENNDQLDANIDDLIGLVPINERNNSFTFSEIVSLFEKEIIYPKGFEKGVTILEYLSTK